MSELGHDPLEGSSKYRAIKELGRGGMGEVFLGEHTSLGSKVVIKLLHAELSNREGLVDRMRLEAQALARLQHANIVRVTDFDRTPSGRPYFVMEYLPGTTLSDDVEKRGGQLPVLEALDIVGQALAGLSAAHEAGMVHRDMKLDNLFVCDRTGNTTGAAGQRVVKILDFGIAKVLDNAGGAPAPLMVPTTTGMVVGTPRFFAPEQARGKQLDGRADIYAMGLVLYTLVAGRGPFDDAGSITEMAKAHVLRKPEPPSRLASQAIPPELDQAVLRAIAKRPEDRFQTASEFAAVLQGIAYQLTHSYHTTQQSATADPRAIAGHPGSTGQRPASSTQPEAQAYARGASQHGHSGQQAGYVTGQQAPSGGYPAAGQPPSQHGRQQHSGAQAGYPSAPQPATGQATSGPQAGTGGAAAAGYGSGGQAASGHGQGAAGASGGYPAAAGASGGYAAGPLAGAGLAGQVSTTPLSGPLAQATASATPSGTYSPTAPLPPGKTQAQAPPAVDPLTQSMRVLPAGVTAAAGSQTAPTSTDNGRVSTLAAIVIVVLSGLLGAASAMLYLRLAA